MGEISNKAEEFTADAKKAAGDFIGDDGLQAEGAVDKAGAQLKQGAEKVADKAQEAAGDAAAQLSDARDKAAETADQLHLDDSRVVIAVLAVTAVLVTFVIRRKRVKSGSRKHPVAKKVAAAGITRALTR